MNTEDLAEIQQYWLNVTIFEGVLRDGSTVRYVGEELALDGDSIVLKFRQIGSTERLGVRFPNPSLPDQSGMAYLDMPIETPRHWILDRRIVLDEELGTTALFTGTAVEHQEWTEYSIAPERWRSGYE